jgi:hypothetical protein
MTAIWGGAHAAAAATGGGNRAAMAAVGGLTGAAMTGRGLFTAKGRLLATTTGGGTLLLLVLCPLAFECAASVSTGNYATARTLQLSASHHHQLSSVGYSQLGL